jgi:hypothetical protein
MLSGDKSCAVTDIHRGNDKFRDGNLAIERMGGNNGLTIKLLGIARRRAGIARVRP